MGGVREAEILKFEYRQPKRNVIVRISWEFGVSFDGGRPLIPPGRPGGGSAYAIILPLLSEEWYGAAESRIIRNVNLK